MSASELAAVKGKLARSEKMVKDLSDSVLTGQKQLNRVEAELSALKKKADRAKPQETASENIEAADLKKIIRRQESRIKDILSELTTYQQGTTAPTFKAPPKPSSSVMDSRVSTQHLARVLENVINELSSMQNSRVLKMTKLIGSKLPETSLSIMAQADFLKKQLGYLSGRK